MRNVIYNLFFLLISLGVFAQNIPEVSSGKIERIENFNSKFVTKRNIDIWLPDGYSETKKYSVLYMHDGQMLYDAATTWNKQSWEVDEVVSKLFSENKINEIIVVGIWNGDKTRHVDYFPQKPFESLTKIQQDSLYNANRSNGSSVFNGKVKSDDYLKFIVKELKPYIDKNFLVYKDRKHTFIAGSSMGGLISMYAICEYPKVFGGAACISTHWPGIFSLKNNPIPDAFYTYLNSNLPNPKTHRIYFDYDTETLDGMYEPLQLKVDEILKTKGFDSSNWITKKFQGDDHSEKAWNKRLHVPIEFLFKK